MIYETALIIGLMEILWLLHIANVIVPYFRCTSSEKGLPDTEPGLYIYNVFKVKEEKMLTVFVPSLHISAPTPRSECQYGCEGALMPEF